MRPLRPQQNENSHLEQLFRDKLRDAEHTPSPDLWEDIEANLETDRRRIRYDHWYYALLALLIPFTAINLWLNKDVERYYDTYVGSEIAELTGTTTTGNAGETSTIIHTSFVQPQPSNILSTTVTSRDHAAYKSGQAMGGDQLTLSVQQPTIITTDIIAAAAQHNNPTNTTKAANATPVGDGTSNSTSQQKITVDPGQLEQEGVSAKGAMALTDYPHEPFVPDRTKGIPMSTSLLESPLNHMRGFNFGIFYAANSSIMVLKENALPELSHDIRHKFGWASNVGIRMGFDFNAGHGIQAELIFDRREDVKYVTGYKGEVIINGLMDLEYLHMPFLYKRKWSKVSPLTNKPASVNFLTGIQYSVLYNAEVASSREVDVNELFPRHQLGFVFGLDYDMYFSDSYYFTVGARGSVTTNTKAFPFVMRQQKANTLNVLLGVHASLNYHIKREKKAGVQYF